ncbi:MAG: FtsQ-type POTRA domain-containing protein [Gammaproteobacteria bacterium]|nr:FtsQ-type POTRA domain-containing protein [Gammaproteobacteria bacterium]
MMHSENSSRPGRTIIAALALVAILLLLISAGTDRLLRPEAFTIQTIHLRGEFNKVDSNLLRDVILPAASGNFFALELKQVEHLAESVAWVDKATVRRRWPRALEVSVQEHSLQARWGDSAWLDIDGDVVEVPAGLEATRLPRFDGPSGSHRQVLKRYQHWGALLAASGLRIHALTLTPRGSWLIEVAPLSVGQRTAASIEARGRVSSQRAFRVVLGKQDLEARIARFARAFSATLFPLSSDIEQVDLRYPNGFAVKWKLKQGGDAAA